MESNDEPRADDRDDNDGEKEPLNSASREVWSKIFSQYGLNYQKMMGLPDWVGPLTSSGALAAGVAALRATEQDKVSRLLDSITKTSGLGMSSANTLEAMLRYAGSVPPLTRRQDYAEPDEPDTAYSSELETPESYFGSTEVIVSSFNDLHSAITKLISKTGDLPLVWRGAKNSQWGLHSHLYRHLMDVNGVVPPDERPSSPQPYPDEDQMVSAEKEILRIARADWRFDDLSGLETFARIQHAGGPTRLIDVTKNPYIAAWFAVEADKKQDDNDARLFAIATRPVVQNDKPSPPDSTLQLDAVGASRDPFWHLLPNSEGRQQLDWGTGARRRVWVPPSYDPRILAQNAAFLVDGVPITSAKTAPYFTIERGKYWRRSDLLASASIYASMKSPTSKPRYNKQNFAPTFSFRISAAAKEEIRDVMETRFGYRSSYIYPDISGLAGYLKTLDLS